MKINEYQQLALRTANTIAMEEPIEKITNGAMGLNGEAGEVIDHLKKYKYQGHELDRDYLAKGIRGYMLVCSFVSQVAWI